MMITVEEILDYEVKASPIALYISSGWGQKLSSVYYAWKVSRKYKRYVYNLTMRRQR